MDDLIEDAKPILEDLERKSYELVSSVDEMLFHKYIFGNNFQENAISLEDIEEITRRETERMAPESASRDIINNSTGNRYLGKTATGTRLKSGAGQIEVSGTAGMPRHKPKGR